MESAASKAKWEVPSLEYNEIDGFIQFYEKQIEEYV